MPFQWYGSCYWQVPLGYYSWDTAEEQCQNDGGHLWTVNSYNEWDAIFNHAAYRKASTAWQRENSNYFDPMDGTHFFLGMKNGEVG